MKFKPLLGTDLSGSVGGIVASHNRGGAYFRNRAIPVNPNTTFQQVVRGLMATLTSLWLNTLTQVLRDTWDLYAENVLIPDALGEPRNVGGLGMYVRSNLPRLQSALPRVDTAPGVFNLGDYTAPSITSITAATSIMLLAFTDTDDWANEDDAAMNVYTSRPQNASINFFKGPYRFAGQILGDSITPPTTPASITIAFPAVAAQKVFIRVNVTRADGRLASDFRDGSLSV